MKGTIFKRWKVSFTEETCKKEQNVYFALNPFILDVSYCLVFFLSSHFLVWHHSHQSRRKKKEQLLGWNHMAHSQVLWKKAESHRSKSRSSLCWPKVKPIPGNSRGIWRLLPNPQARIKNLFSVCPYCQNSHTLVRVRFLIEQVWFQYLLYVFFWNLRRYNTSLL